MDVRSKTALVLGVTGGIGGETAKALLAEGWAVRALIRDPDRFQETQPSLAAKLDIVKGDALHQDDVMIAAQGVQAILHGVNPPGYRDWERVVLPMMDNTLTAAAAIGDVRVVLPGTVYNYDPAAHSCVTDSTPQQPLSRKGKIRVQMEQRLQDAVASSRVTGLIVRAGDYFGPNSRNTWFGQALVKPGKPIRRVVNPGYGHGHSWAFLPDVAEAIVRLLEIPEKLRPFERVGFEGLWDSDGTEMLHAIRTVTGNASLRQARFPWWIMRLLVPFGGLPKELADIEPYWRHPLRLDNRRLKELLGQEPHTPLNTAIRQTLSGLEVQY